MHLQEIGGGARHAQMAAAPQQLAHSQQVTNFSQGPVVQLGAHAALH